MSSHYDPLPIEAFGRELIATGDLDPVYVALWKDEMPAGQRARWLVAYWCCYHSGASSWLSEADGPAFWRGMRVMARNEDSAPTGGRWPRGRERRHFRGGAAIEAVARMAEAYPLAEELVSELIVPGAMSYPQVAKRITRLPMFGPWIAFKVADMIERVLGISVSFTGADVMMFDQPYQAALLYWEMKHAGVARPTGREAEWAAIRWAVDSLRAEFAGEMAPPRGDRGIDLQEIETVLCKWKSHLGGHYPRGIDTRELRHGLDEWAPVSETARRMALSTPKEAAWGLR